MSLEPSKGYIVNGVYQLLTTVKNSDVSAISKIIWYKHVH